MASKTSQPAAPAADGAQAAQVPDDIARLSFEEALKALEEIVQRLETGRVDLDAAVAAYERGVWLRKHCEARLGEARTKVERIGIGADGGPSTTPLDVE
ncbi:exodeoxyribonuclease VII small subunit [uncultured Rhodospira sp.]|mgnify:CR=1 FL=1|uniref:exodeoxyribonuclease VII small subunit n=1 Tax=uncultured Rhodospira sp. TaxID=1936189 RepID=UPI0026259BF8|nr:exodeoxyribonuclease VII small subunit [uncultured Rhodospira sp.]